MNMHPASGFYRAQEGDSLTLTCAFDEGLPSSRNEWSFIPSLPQTSNPKSKVPDVILMASTSSHLNEGGMAVIRLEIKDITKHHSGYYTCSAWNEKFPQKINQSLQVNVECK